MFVFFRCVAEAIVAKGVRGLLEMVPGGGFIYDVADDITRNINAQTLLNFNSQKLTKSLSISGLLGNAISDNRSTTNALKGQDFLDPNFVSINNTTLRQNRTTLAQRRLLRADANLGAAIGVAGARADEGHDLKRWVVVLAHERLTAGSGGRRNRWRGRPTRP